jgi:hypothetical protein
MMAVITTVRLERRSKGVNDLLCWHVNYRLCGVSAETVVYAHNKGEARAKALNQLRRCGLKVAQSKTTPVPMPGLRIARGT